VVLHRVCFLPIVALFLRFPQAGSEEGGRQLSPGRTTLRFSIMYTGDGLAFVVAYLVGGSNTLVTDAAGVVWHTASIAEAQPRLPSLR